MKLVTVVLCFVITGSIINAQKLHTGAEILKIMSDSKLSYQVNALKETLSCDDNSMRLNLNTVYRYDTEDGFATRKYNINEKAQPLMVQAELMFRDNQIDSALRYYKLALEADTSLYYVMTYIGQMYDSKNDLVHAKEWFKKAIDHNYIDYMAHWFLADANAILEEWDDAVHEITIAQILNRNNTNIATARQRIYKAAGRSGGEWCFVPQYIVKKTEDNKIYVGFGSKWVGYALAKSLWTYEPGYRESMGVKFENTSIEEEKECLINELLGLENAKIDFSDDDQLRVLHDAALDKHLQEYILYDVILPKVPSVVYQLPVQLIIEIEKYILKHRHKK